MDQPLTGPPPKKSDQRRSDRFPVVSPVEAKWHEPGDKIIVEAAQATEVNAQGGLLQMKTYPGIGTQMELIGLLSREIAAARVVAIRRGRDGRLLGVAVELLTPSESFWGMNFQLKKTSNELVKLEQAIRSGGIDPRILMEFRDAVDYVRKTAWAVQEWQERQFQKHDPQTVIPLLTSERIRRTTQLCIAITTDLASHHTLPDTSRVNELLKAAEAMSQRLTELTNNANPPH